MEIIWFTVIAIVLYFVADFIVQRIEATVGRRLENRTLIFFAILLAFALGSFALIRRFFGG
jgi:hypothetical protein